MKNRKNKSSLEGVLALVLFCIFAVCILAVLLIGAATCKRLAARQQNVYAERMIPQYLATKVRQADRQGAVQIGEFGGVAALELVERFDTEEYITRIYCYDGYLRELFSTASGEFAPEDGEKIQEAGQVDFSLQEGVLSIAVIQQDGEKTELKLLLRSTEGGNRQ